MKFERKKNTIRNIKFGILNKAVTILGPFALRTVLIYTLGVNYLGLSSLFTSVLQVLSLSELGIGSAMVFRMYQPIADNDDEKIGSLLRLYKYIYRTIGAVILTAGLLIMPFLKHFIHGDYPADVNLYVLYLLYLFNSSESYFISSYKSSILSAYQRRDIISNIGLFAHIALYTVQIVCLICLKNYYAYVVWLPIATIAEQVLLAKYVDRHYGRYMGDFKIDIEDLRTLLLQVRDLFGHKLSAVVTNSLDTIVISVFLGLQIVTVYNNYYYLMSAVSGILDIAYQAVLAGIGNSIVAETKEKNWRDFQKFTLLNAWIVGWCSICFLCLYQPMIKLWMGKHLMLPFGTIILLCIYFYIWKIRQTVLLYKDAAGLWGIDRWKPYIEIMVNLITNIFLVNLIGINGIVISTILSMVLVSLPWETQVFFQAFFGIRIYAFVKKNLLCLFVTMGIGVLTYSVCTIVPGEGVFSFVFKIIICIVFPNTLVLLGGIQSLQIREVVEWVFSMLHLNRLKK